MLLSKAQLRTSRHRWFTPTFGKGKFSFSVYLLGSFFRLLSYILDRCHVRIDVSIRSSFAFKILLIKFNNLNYKQHRLKCSKIGVLDCDRLLFIHVVEVEIFDFSALRDSFLGIEFRRYEIVLNVLLEIE